MPASGNVGLAFGLTAAAGLATAIGASIVFCADMAKPRLLAGSLGFAAGVMLYVSFAEIFMKKSLAGFEDAGYSEVEAYRYGTLAFFCGFLVVAILDKIVHFMVNLASKRGERLTASQSQAVLLDNEDAVSTLGGENSGSGTSDDSPTAIIIDNNNNDDGSGSMNGSGTMTVAPQTMIIGGNTTTTTTRKTNTTTSNSSSIKKKVEVGETVLSSDDIETATGSLNPLHLSSHGNTGMAVCACHSSPEMMTQLTSSVSAVNAAKKKKESQSGKKEGGNKFKLGFFGVWNNTEKKDTDTGGGTTGQQLSDDVTVDGDNDNDNNQQQEITSGDGDEKPTTVGGDIESTTSGRGMFGGMFGGRLKKRQGNSSSKKKKKKAAMEVESTSRETPAVVELMQDDAHAFALKKMGLLTAAAIFIHNFPEGLATFSGALADPSIGIGIAVAIAIHNIPEGICVAMPIYYATGSKMKAFMWALLSGMSEPVGALLGWLVLYGDTALSFAIVFAFVGGMMVYISVKELIPTALKYDPKDSVATSCVVCGMVVMAASLLLFTL